MDLRALVLFHRGFCGLTGGGRLFDPVDGAEVSMSASWEIIRSQRRRVSPVVKLVKE